MKAGWQTRLLGDLCDVLDRRRKPITKRDRIAGAYPYYGATGVLGYVEGYLFDEKLVLVGEDGAKWSSGENTAFAVEGKIWVNNHAHVLRPHRGAVCDNWLIYFLNHSDVSEFVSGLTVPKLNQGNLRGIPIPLAPLTEQRRIVGILDEAFEGIATAKANAEKNLQNARALFESHLNEVFAKCREGWVEEPIGSTCDVKHGFAFRGANFSRNVPEGNPLVITPGNFTEHGELSFTEKNTKRFSGEPPCEFVFDVGDLVVVMTDLSSKMKILGKPAFVETDNVLHNQRIGRVVFLNDRIEKRFLYYFMMTEGFLKHIKASATGTMVKHTAPKRIRSSIVRYPCDRKEQRAIIERLDSLHEATQRLESIYQQKLATLDTLKQSLLHQAFTGAL